MKRFKIKLEGTTPLLHHRMREEELFALLGTKSTRKKDKEEKTPREIADSHAYKVGNTFVIPTGYIVGAFKGVASEYKQKNSQRKSMKGIVGGIFRPENEFEVLTDKEVKENFKNYKRQASKILNFSKVKILVALIPSA